MFYETKGIIVIDDNDIAGDTFRLSQTVAVTEGINFVMGATKEDTAIALAAALSVNVGVLAGAIDSSVRVMGNELMELVYEPALSQKRNATTRADDHNGYHSGNDAVTDTGRHLICRGGKNASKIFIRNNGAGDVFIAMGGDAVPVAAMGGGKRILAGSEYVIDSDHSLGFASQPIYAISLAGGVNEIEVSRY